MAREVGEWLELGLSSAVEGGIVVAGDVADNFVG